MKYEVTLTKTERKTIELEAPNRDEALFLARNENPGFHADEVTEITDSEEEKLGLTHTLEGACEFCDTFIWNGDPYVMDAEEAIIFCKSCVEKLGKE